MRRVSAAPETRRRRGEHERRRSRRRRPRTRTNYRCSGSSTAGVRKGGAPSSESRRVTLFRGAERGRNRRRDERLHANRGTRLAVCSVLVNARFGQIIHWPLSSANPVMDTGGQGRSSVPFSRTLGVAFGGYRDTARPNAAWDTL